MTWWQRIQSLFSAPSLAAARNVLTAFAAFLSVLGIAGLTQAKLQSLVDAVVSLGTAMAAVIAAVSALAAIVMPIIAGFKSTDAARRAAVSLQPHTIVVQSATADGIIKAANAVAALPDVQQVVSSPRVAATTPSQKVVAAPDAK